MRNPHAQWNPVEAVRDILSKPQPKVAPKKKPEPEKKATPPDSRANDK